MARETKRNVISFTENVYRFGVHSEFSIENLREAAEEFANKHGVEIDNLLFEFESHEDYYMSESYLTFKASRLETDEEFEERKNRLALANKKQREARAAEKKAKDEADFTEWQRLSEKFGKG